MQKKNSKNMKNGVSRREFMRFLGLTTGAAAGSLLLQAPGLAAESSGATLPKFKIHTLNSTAEKIYKCKPGIKRFNEANMAFKQVGKEIGQPFFHPLAANLKKNVANSEIGSGIKVDSPDEARMHLAFSMGAGTWNNMFGPYGEGKENQGLLSWNPLYVPKDLAAHPLHDPNAVDLTKKIKQMSRIYGADMTGVAKLNRKWVYSKTCRNMYDASPARTKPMVFSDVKTPRETDGELVIPESVTNAIVFVVGMPRASLQLSPSSTQTMGGTGMGYGRMGLTAVALAEAIRSLGYNAIPCMNDTGLSVPMAIDAGLGQLGRLGYLVTPWFGPHVRIGKVLTDMPLVADRPIDFGVTEYCETCGICARECPSGAISADRERSYTPPASAGSCSNPGALKWHVDGKKCLRWWMESGNGCSRCMDVCPYTRMTWTDNYDGNPDPDKFWDLNLAPFGYQSVKY